MKMCHCGSGQEGGCVLTGETQDGWMARLRGAGESKPKHVDYPTWMSWSRELDCMEVL